MLRISQKQMQDIATVLADQTLIRHARKRFPGVFDKRSEDEMTGLVATVRTSARSFAFKEQAEVLLLFELYVMYGPHFHQSPWARDILAMPSWSASRKADVLRERVRRQVSHF